MSRPLRVMSLMTALSILAGCASTGEPARNPVCALLGGAAGAGGTAAVVDTAAAIAGGAFVGALGGMIICHEGETWVPATHADADGDGVTDDRDRCPDTPKGVTVDGEGCTLDSDGDGVPDSYDRCAGTPEGVAVDEHGCPLDSDGDGVADHLDRCPGTPPGTAVDDEGCPFFALEAVNFEYDKARLTPDARAILDDAAETLAANAGVRVRVEGHTDSRGSAEYNRRLSRRRAQAVIDYLVTRGIARTRLSAIGYGEAHPVATNDSATGRARNRRVEFSILE